MPPDLRLVVLNANAFSTTHSESLTVTYCSLNALLKSLSGTSSFLPE